MTAVKPGLAKLNIKPQAGSLNAMKSSFASATRAQGVSYGIMAQRSIFSTGMLRNPKLAYSGAIASTRAMLNAPRPMMFANVMPHQCNHNSGDDTMNKFMMGMMAMNMVAEMTAGITKGIKDIKASRADRSEKNTNTEAPKQKNPVNESSAGSITSTLAKADTSKGVKESLADMDKAIGTLDSSIKENNESIKKEQDVQQQLNSDIDVLTQEISGLNADLRALQIQKTSAQSRGENVTEIDTKIKEIESQIKAKEQEKTTKETQLQNSKSCEEALQKENSGFEKELADKKNTKATYEAKLPKMEQKENASLTKLQSKMNDLRTKYNSETKDDKKAEIATKYTAVAKEFNEILSNSTCTGFRQAGLSLN